MDSGAAFTGADTGDTFNATHLTLTALDSLDGGAGADTLNVTDTGTTAAATFANTTIKNIETLNLTSVTGLNGDALDTSAGFTGLTTANVVLTAPGANQSLTVGSSTAAVLSVTTQAARNLTVLGGTSVDVTTGLATTGTVTVGSTLAAPTGAVTVKSTGDYADADVTLGAISVTGGTTVSVTQSAGITAAEVAAAATDTTNKTVTQSAVTVTGTATTTSVSVTQSAAQAVTAGSVAEDGVIGIANGNVTVNDVNRTSTTKAGAISSVTLDSYGAATVNSGALTSLTLKGTGTSVDASTLGALATAANTALALNVAGLTNTGAITVDTDIKTINLDGQVKASSLGTLAAAGMTALNISGSQKVTITSLNAAQLTAITSTSAGDVTISSALGTGVAYTGAAGKDTITLGATTKAITTGAGDDAVTVTVNGGDGVDTFTFSSTTVVEQDGSGTTRGTVINLSADALSQSTVYTKTVELLGAGNGLYLSAAGATVAAGTTAYLFNNESTTNAVVNDTLASIENVNGTNLDDLIIGSTGNNALVGGSGTDYIEGGAGDDYLDGSAGDSIDKLFGGTGNDTYAVTDASEVDIIVEAAIGGTDTLLFTGDLSLAGVAFGATLAGAVGDASLANIEQVVLAADADAVFTATQVSGLSLLIGEAAAGTSSITVNGATSGTQTIDLSGFKFATAGYSYTDNSGALTTMSDLTSGTDLININGGSDVDTIKGTSYADVIYAGGGADVMDGGNGVDTFVINFASAVTPTADSTASALDVISNAASDRIKLVDSDTSAVTLALGLNDTSGDVTAAAVDVLSNNGVVTGITKGNGSTAVALTIGTGGSAETDTLSEVVGLLNTDYAPDGNIVYFTFDADSYVFVQNGAADVLVKLAGVTGDTALTLAAGGILTWA